VKDRRAQVDSFVSSLRPFNRRCRRPLRLPLGTDTLKAIADKNAYVVAEMETWKALSASMDFSA